MSKRVKSLRWPPRVRTRSSGSVKTPETDQANLRQPNERDTSADSQTVDSKATRESMSQAHTDLKRGLEDTDCRNQAAEVIDEASKR